MSQDRQTQDATGAAVAAPVDRPVRPAAEARGYGRFTVPARWVHEFRTELKRVMGLCIVFRAEHLFHSDEIEYLAASEHFRPVPLGEMMPEYRWHFTDDGDVWAEEQPF